jgi:adenosylmethionine---8-amino-7-oxononanoate aminotransferase
MNTDRLSHHWLPFTQMAAIDLGERTFVRARGTSLVDARGNELFDAISSVWTTVHGHCHPRIVTAIARQAATLDHSTALGATNPAAEELASRLALLTGLDRAFFSSDGASAVEAALKMALQYWENLGQPQRHRFVRLVDAYHGDTAGAMSVSDIPVFKSHFGAICFESLAFDALGEVLEREDVAAVIVEPIVQAAAGMRIVDAVRYEPLRHERVPLLIADEIATGFGRTGAMFAFQTLGLRPDLLCLGKGITGGALALSATLASAPVYDAFLGDFHEERHLYHGHSYAANPIACAAASASLDLFESEGTLVHVESLSAALEVMLRPVRTHPRVKEVRQAGLMCGIELDGRPFAGSRAPTPGWHVAASLYDRGQFTRPIGDVVQLVPPLSSRPEELGSFVSSLLEILQR